MLKENAFLTGPDQDELRGFGRTVAEIQWLLVVLVLVYLVAVDLDEESGVAIYSALGLLGAFVLTLHYVQFYKKETLTKLAIETVVMFAFITWVTWYSGKIDSPLLNLYLLPIIASALILGKLITSILTAAVVWGGCQNQGPAAKKAPAGGEPGREVQHAVVLCREGISHPPAEARIR